MTIYLQDSPIRLQTIQTKKKQYKSNNYIYIGQMHGRVYPQRRALIMGDLFPRLKIPQAGFSSDQQPCNSTANMIGLGW